MGMAELEKSRVEAETELDQLRAQKAFITNEVIALKENLTKVFYHLYRIVSSNTKDRLLFGNSLLTVNFTKPHHVSLFVFQPKGKMKQGQT